MMHESHDTDPAELTPPDGKVRFILPPGATMSHVIDRVNRLHGIIVRCADETGELHQWLNGGEPPCPLPSSRCAALEMGETNFIGLVEMQKKLRWQTWSLAALTILIPAAAVIAAALLSNSISATARTAAQGVIATEMPKHLKSTEDTAREGGKAGAREFWAELQRTQPVPPIKR